MALPRSHPTSSAPAGRRDATSAVPESAEPEATLDEIQEMARNGELEKFLDKQGIPAAPLTVRTTAKRRMGQGPSFDRTTFNQTDYDECLKRKNK